MRSTLIVVLALAAAFIGSPAVQGGDKVYELAKQGLTIEGKISASDAKFKLVPLPKQNEVMLPGKAFRVKLLGGKRYRVAMISNQVDSVLVIKDAADKQQAWDDDSAGGLNALIMFDPPGDGTYTIHALSLNGPGPFSLQIREAIVHEVGAGLTLKGNIGKAKTASFAYNVKLVAGKTYVIDMVSPNQNALDPYLILLDPAGKKITEDDDGGDGLNARITYRVENTGTYRIVCTSFERAGAGAYLFTVREKK
jgi:hypothetical protein